MEMLLIFPISLDPGPKQKYTKNPCRNLFCVVRISINNLLARRDECPESYCRTPGVGVGVSVRVHKNFNLAHNS